MNRKITTLATLFAAGAFAATAMAPKMDAASVKNTSDKSMVEIKLRRRQEGRQGHEGPQVLQGHEGMQKGKKDQAQGERRTASAARTRRARRKPART